MSEVLSPESVKLLEDVRLFLEGDSSMVVVIQSQEQKNNLVALGNELQKREKALDKKRLEERAAKVNPIEAAINAEFKPEITKIQERKQAAITAINEWNRAENERIKKIQDRFNATAEKERLVLEAKIGTNEEKIQAYRDRIAQIESQKPMFVESAEISLTMDKEIATLQRKIESLGVKVEAIQQKAAQVVAPIAAPVMQSKGERKTVEWIVRVINWRKCIEWCLANNKLNYLALESKVVAAVAKAEQGLVVDGLEIVQQEKTSFSGR